MSETIVGVATAVPAFIGYTERAGTPGLTPPNAPVWVASVPDFERQFGGGILGARPAGAPIFSMTRAGDVAPIATLFALYDSVRLFYANGGGPCYVVSVGTYVDATGTWTAVSGEALLRGVAAAGSMAGPTLLVVPDASLLTVAEYAVVAQAMLKQAGELRDRIALLDVPHARGVRSAPGPELDAAVAAFRASVGSAHLGYGAAYLPHLNASIVQPADLDDTMFAPVDPAVPLVPAQLASGREQAARLLNRLPASAAVAGVMHRIDSTRGVWTAPANVGLDAVVGLAFSIDDRSQADLNVSVDGKAINAIRDFAGRGPTIWGARTLDGNSIDFRYVPVRRFVIYLEQSIGPALGPFAAAANDAHTWASIVDTVSGFLHGLWKEGGLEGDTPEDAFSVYCGLGTTMTPQDVLDGNLVVTVLVAISRPAEFIELTFKHPGTHRQSLT